MKEQKIANVCFEKTCIFSEFRTNPPVIFWKVLNDECRHGYREWYSNGIRSISTNLYPLVFNKPARSSWLAILFVKIRFWTSIALFGNYLLTISILSAIYPKYLHRGGSNGCACSREPLVNIKTHHIHPKECMQERKLRNETNPLAGHSVFPVSLSIVEIWSVMYWAIIKIYFE